MKGLLAALLVFWSLAESASGCASELLSHGQPRLIPPATEEEYLDVAFEILAADVEEPSARAAALARPEFHRSVATLQRLLRAKYLPPFPVFRSPTNGRIYSFPKLQNFVAQLIGENKTVSLAPKTFRALNELTGRLAKTYEDLTRYQSRILRTGNAQERADAVSDFRNLLWTPYAENAAEALVRRLSESPPSPEASILATQIHVARRILRSEISRGQREKQSVSELEKVLSILDSSAPRAIEIEIERWLVAIRASAETADPVLQNDLQKYLKEISGPTPTTLLEAQAYWAAEVGVDPFHPGTFEGEPGLRDALFGVDSLDRAIVEKAIRLVWMRKRALEMSLRHGTVPQGVAGIDLLGVYQANLKRLGSGASDDGT